MPWGEAGHPSLRRLFFCVPCADARHVAQPAPACQSDSWSLSRRPVTSWSVAWCHSQVPRGPPALSPEAMETSPVLFFRAERSRQETLLTLGCRFLESRSPSWGNSSLMTLAMRKGSILSSRSPHTDLSLSLSRNHALHHPNQTRWWDSAHRHCSGASVLRGQFPRSRPTHLTSHSCPRQPRGRSIHSIFFFKIYVY